MINTEKERAKALRRLNGLRIFEKKTTGLIQAIGIEYSEPLLRARAEIEALERAIAEFDQLRRVRTEQISIDLIKGLPKYLIGLRHQTGMPQFKLAERLGISKQVMSKYEKDYGNLKLNRIVEILEALHAASNARTAARQAFMAQHASESSSASPACDKSIITEKALACHKPAGGEEGLPPSPL